MWYLAEPDGAVAMTTFRKSQKALNLRRDPRCTLLLESGRTYPELKGLIIRGRAEIDDDTEHVLDVLEAVQQKYNPGSRARGCASCCAARRASAAWSACGPSASRAGTTRSSAPACTDLLLARQHRALRRGHRGGSRQRHRRRRVADHVPAPRLARAASRSSPTRPTPSRSSPGSVAALYGFRRELRGLGAGCSGAASRRSSAVSRAAGCCCARRRTSSSGSCRGSSRSPRRSSHSRVRSRRSSGAGAPSSHGADVPQHPRWAEVLAYQLLVSVYGGYFGAGHRHHDARRPGAGRLHRHPPHDRAPQRLRHLDQRRRRRVLHPARDRRLARRARPHRRPDRRLVAERAGRAPPATRRGARRRDRGRRARWLRRFFLRGR